MVNRAHTAVVGVGTVGSMAFWQLARDGVDVVGFDRYNPGHANGGAGGDSRHFRLISENPAYVGLSKASLPDWRLLEEDSGLSLLVQTGELAIGKAESRYVRNALANSHEFDIPSQQLTNDELKARYPGLRFDDGQVAVLDPQSGYLHAGVSIAAAAAVAVEKGARLVSRAEIVSIAPEADGVHLVTDAGEEWIVQRLIVTVGAWVNTVLGEYLPPLDIQKYDLHWYPIRHPELFDQEHFPTFVYGDVEHGFAGWPTLDGSTIKTSFTAPLERLRTPDDFSLTMPFDALERMDSYVERFIPDAIPTAIRHAFGMDALTQDGHFVLGPLEADPRIILGVGMNAHGFKMAPAVGRALAGWAKEESPLLDLDHFSASRLRYWPAVSRSIREDSSAR